MKYHTTKPVNSVAGTLGFLYHLSNSIINPHKMIYSQTMTSTFISSMLCQRRKILFLSDISANKHKLHCCEKCDIPLHIK